MIKFEINNIYFFIINIIKLIYRCINILTLLNNIYIYILKFIYSIIYLYYLYFYYYKIFETKLVKFIIVYICA